jgi:outer membrane lipoprotein-sorting protein
MNKAAAGLLLSMGAAAQDARQIVEESERRNRAQSMTYEGRLQTIAASGRTSEKSWRMERLGAYGDSKAVLRFTAPPEVKGVALLVINHPDRSSDQWMYTPNIGRERRIAAQDRSTRFFGTDFSFEDLEERDADQYEFRLLGEETIDGSPCWKIEATPRERKTSQYSSSRLWIRKDNYVAAQYEGWSGSRAVRRLHYRDIRRIQNVWTAHALEMNDLKRNSRTVLRLESVRYNVPLAEDGFTIQALRREQ